MIKHVYVCDRCKNETDTPLRIYGCRVDVETTRVVAEAEPAHNELCPDCFAKLIDWIKAGQTETNYEAVCRLYREGKEIAEIEQLTGIPCAAISRVVINEGLGAERYPVTEDPMETFDDGAGRGYRISADKRAKVIEMLKDGYPPEQIAIDLKLKPKTVAKVIQGWQEASDGD